MIEIFLEIINRSITVSYVIVGILILRQCIKRYPKILSYLLWSVVAIRLICPFTIESTLSLLKINPKVVSGDIVYQRTPKINSGIETIDDFVNNSLENTNKIEELTSINPLQIMLFFCSSAWLLGIVIFLTYGIISYYTYKKILIHAVLLKDNIFLVEGLENPFVIGIIKPCIYLPTGLKENEMSYIIKHEQIHVKRKDYIIKCLAFLLLTIYWFHPLVWLSYYLMSLDMELSCDENVIIQLGTIIKKDYANSLLKLSTKRTMLRSPLAFGKGEVKTRIINILKYKKIKNRILLPIIIVIFAIAILLSLNPKTQIEKLPDPLINNGNNVEVAKEGEIVMTTDEGTARIRDTIFDNGYYYFVEAKEQQEQELLRAVYRIKEGTEKSEEIAEIEGKLITIYNDCIYYLGTDNNIWIFNYLKSEQPNVYDKCGIDVYEYNVKSYKYFIGDDGKNYMMTQYINIQTGEIAQSRILLYGHEEQ